MSISRCLQVVPRPSASALFVLLAAAATLVSPAVLCAQALLVEDINTAGTASAGYAGFDEDVAVAGLLHFFSGDDGLTGREPWVLHLDTGVAERLGDLYPGPTSSYPEQFVAIGSSVLFVADSPTTGLELWVSDGTPEGTLLVEDIAPGAASSSPYELFAIPSARAVFRADDGALGAELWVSDGTAGGTMLVDDIAPGTASSSPSQFAVSAGKLFFRANDGTSGYELWTWTTGGVSQVVDIEPGAGSSSPSTLYAVGTTVVFSACTTADGCEPWRSDGTGPGTCQLADLHPTGSSSPNNFLWHSGLTRLFFVADDGVHGRELWQRSGGVETRVTDISVGLDDSSPTGLGALSASLVFTADDGGSGTRLFGYDGASVSQLKSLSTAGAPNRPRYTLSWNGRVYFYEGSSCWQTDGTPVGTITFESYCSSSLAFAIGDGRLLYSKSVSGESEIWSIDSADVKTQETDLSTYSSSPSGFTWLGATAFFSADDAVSGRELWVSDGTPEGTELIDLHSGPGASSPAQFTLFEDEIWFHATTPATGDELWHSDGSAAGTQPYEIIPGSDSSYPSQMVVLGSSLFVVAYDDLARRAALSHRRRRFARRPARFRQRVVPLARGARRRRQPGLLFRFHRRHRPGALQRRRGRSRTDSDRDRSRSRRARCPRGARGVERRGLLRRRRRRHRQADLAQRRRHGARGCRISPAAIRPRISRRVPAASTSSTTIRRSAPKSGGPTAS